MILERLLDFHDATEDILTASLKKQPVRWLLELDEEGRFLRLTESGSTKKEWTELVTPYTKRSGSTPPPFLLVDKPNYVLGHLAEAGKLSATKRQAEQAKADDRHAAYVDLVRACAAAVDDERIAAFVRFLEDDDELALARAAAEEASARDKAPMKQGDLIAPRVGEKFLSQLPAARRFWAEQQDAEADQNSRLTSECMVTGRVGAVARTHPVELLVGPNRVGLVSGNENAFLSFGLQQSEIAPMGFTVARKYGEALRHLLSDDAHNLRTGGVTWVYWTREPVGDPLFAVKEADPEEVGKLLRAPRSGDADAAVQPNEFYALAVSANTSRMVVRSWVTATVEEVQANIARNFANMRLLDRDGQPRYHKHTALAGSLVRDFKDLPDFVTAALLNTALWGRPLPLSLLHQAVQRARAEREHVLTHPRAALIKLVICSNPSLAERYPMSDQLNPDHPHPAYHCGRLLALLDNIQSEAVGARATLVDRYYGAASATPAAVFGVLMRNAQNHLGKLRKTKGGLAYYFDQQIGQIADQLGTAGFPRTLTLEEQGLFALGFYQQKNRPSDKKGDADATPSAAE